MADIDLSGTESIFSTNVSIGGKVKAEYFEYSSGPHIGELSVVDITSSGSGQALFSTVWTKITQWATASTFAGITSSTANNNFTVNATGLYFVSLSASVLTTRNGEYEFEVFLDSSSQENVKARETVPSSTQANPVSVSASGVLNVDSTGEAVDLRCRSTGGGSILFNSANFTIFKIG